jgi:hypothetical protein
VGIFNASFVMNAAFCFLFVAEAIVKMLGLGKAYFKQGWNVFDFVITFSSFAGVIVDLVVAFSSQGPSTSSSLLGAIVIARVFRVLRILRLLRSIKYASGIRRLLTTLVISAPALLNIGRFGCVWFWLLLLFFFLFCCACSRVHLIEVALFRFAC